MAARIKSVGYPWRKWTDGKPWRARKGRDFKCSVRGFTSTLYTYAGRHGYHAQASVIDKRTVDFQFEKKPEKK